jgi:hypothetical protein
MRFKYQTLLVAALSILALSGVAAASASAHGFVAAKEGPLKGGQTKSGGDWTMTISTGSAWACEGATVSGKAKAGSQTTLDETITGLKCAAHEWVYSPIELEYNIAGTAKLLNTVTVESRANSCHLTLKPAGNEAFKAKDSNQGSSEISEEDNFQAKAESSGGGDGDCGKAGAVEIGLTGLLAVGIEGTGNTLQVN